MVPEMVSATAKWNEPPNEVAANREPLNQATKQPCRLRLISHHRIQATLS
jgi:hypothetical protein